MTPRPRRPARTRRPAAGRRPGRFGNDARNNRTTDISKGCPGPRGHHVRFWPAETAGGAPIPYTWVLAMDDASINYDYQDTMYLITNADPAP